MKIGLDLNSPEDERILNECYYLKMTNEDYNVVPTIMGFTSNEAIAFTGCKIYTSNFIENFL